MALPFISCEQFTYTEENLKVIHEFLDYNRDDVVTVFEMVMRDKSFLIEQLRHPEMMLRLIERWSFLKRGLIGGREFKTVLAAYTANIQDSGHKLELVKRE